MGGRGTRGDHGGRLAELYRLHVDEAFRLAYLLTGNRALAEDIAQDAFIRLAGRFLHLRRPEEFSAYLRHTVVNLGNSHFRRRQVEKRYLQCQAELREPQIAGPDLGTNDQMRLALLTLPRRQRTAVVLRFYEDLPDTKAAEIMGCRPGTVRSLVTRGMQTLRVTLGELSNG